MEGSQPQGQQQSQNAPNKPPVRPEQPSRLAPSASAGDREWENATQRAVEEEDRQAELNAHIAEVREQERARWNETDAALVSAQHKYADHIAKLPTPEALEELGTPVGDHDPLRGPSS